MEQHSNDIFLDLIWLILVIALVGTAVWAIVGHITGRAQHDFMQRRHRDRIRRMREGWGE